MAYDIQLTVIIYKKKSYISHLAAIALGEEVEYGNTIMFGTRPLLEVRPKDKHLIEKFPVYDLDSMLQSFVDPNEGFDLVKVDKKDCFTFYGSSFISLSKLQIKNKYNLRFALPSVKIFGAYYILCGKQKDVNTRIVIIPE